LRPDPTDGGIDAMAALSETLREAVVSLAPQDQQNLKLVFGRVMAEVDMQIITPAVRAFPELEPDDATWDAIVKSRAGMRANAG
jgi:hypothetical protein